jgi:hypothetical protein
MPTEEPCWGFLNNQYPETIKEIKLIKRKLKAKRRLTKQCDCVSIYDDQKISIQTSLCFLFHNILPSPWPHGLMASTLTPDLVDKELIIGSSSSAN